MSSDWSHIGVILIFVSTLLLGCDNDESSPGPGEAGGTVAEESEGSEPSISADGVVQDGEPVSSSTPEICNGVDDDLDGSIDEWDPNTNRSCRIEVPAGSFRRGCADAALGCSADEGPVTDVYLGDFAMDRTEVTRAAYADCVSAGACTAAAPLVASAAINAPVTGVSWDQAATYCAYVGARLPTEAEWEKAARGPSGGLYPWGDDQPTCAHANFIATGCDHEQLLSVGRYAAGQSPYGALDMVGNAGEWVADWYDNTYYEWGVTTNPTGPTEGKAKVFRGGSMWYGEDALRTTDRWVEDPSLQMGDVGFRCARSID